jgi:hypothetical protein
MTDKQMRAAWWAVTITYISLTYASLGAMPALWERFNALLGGRGVVVQYGLYLAVGIWLLGYIVLVRKERRVWRYVIFCCFVATFFVMLKMEKNPGEKIHMAQYGLLGVLTYNALKIDFDRNGSALYLVGAAICIVAGALDEVIQGILPNRHFTWHDVLINGLSGILALLVIRIVFLESNLVVLQEKRPESPKF